MSSSNIEVMIIRSRKEACLIKQAFKHALIALIFVTMLLPQLYNSVVPVLAQSSSDIPGELISVGQTIEGVVDTTTKPNDVYAVEFVAGRQVKISIASDSQHPWVSRIYLLSPASTSIQDNTMYEVLGNKTIGSGGHPYTRSNSITYTPAISGIYYIWINGWQGNTAYELVLEETGQLFDAPNVNDIPGVLVDSGTYKGVVDLITDVDDVYAVEFVAGRQVKISIASDSQHPWVSRIYLLSPASTSIQDNTMYEVLGNKTIGSGGHPYTRSNSITYTPAISGIYYIWINGWQGNTAYELDILGAVPVGSLPDSEPALKIGDINGDGVINVLDATMLMQHVLGLKVFTDTQKKAADVNGDGKIDVVDIVFIVQKALGIINKFPVE